jgi:uncharacterized sporulation protein YeaH/YhbH (DUF444 family)
MTTKPPVSATFIFVDRRKTARGKSLGNRSKLLDRIKESIRQSKPEDIDAGGVKAATGGAAGAKTFTNPVKIARNALHEPTYHYDPNSGERDIVLVGNDTWERGDEFPVSSEGGGKGGKGKGKGEGNGPGEDGEDDFIINISRDEFYNVFFEDCELPDLQETSEKELPEAVMKPAGYQREGSAAQLSVVRSYRNSIGRRHALTADSRSELEELEEELALLDERLAGNPLDSAANTRWVVVAARIEELKAKIAATPFFERLDLRYRKSERVQVKSADAVLFMLMDISGSMDEDKKRAARKFFSLQYAFIAKKYPNTDLVFIPHTDSAEEVDEEEFFTTRKSGGTVVSPAFALAHQIIKARYDTNQTNIYLSYAGDGDNWDSDNPEVISELEEKGLLGKLRHAVYVQVGHTAGGGFSYGTSVSLWNIMQSIAKGNPKLHTVKIADDSAVFSAFRSIYSKAKVKA